MVHRKKEAVMYRKAMVILLLLQLVFLVGYLGIVRSNRAQDEGIKSVYEIRLNQIVLANQQNSVLEISKNTSSEQRVITYHVLERKPEIMAANYSVASLTNNASDILLSQEDYENLLRIVEAEASGEDEEGKLLVANVVLNRVESDSFPDTITEVIFQRSKGVTQFSPVANGRFWTVEISEETISAVDRALEGEDLSQGALYFAARKHANKKSMRWFDEKLDYLFTHGGHEFFTE